MSKKKIVAVGLLFILLYCMLIAIFLLAGISVVGSLIITIVLVICNMCTVRYASTIKYAYSAVRKKIQRRLVKHVVADTTDKMYPLISTSQELSLENTIKISFTGDLILLREVVERALNNDTKEYDFSSMFQFVSENWKSCDLSIGVLEGPMGGKEYPYSTSNYADGAPLALNFPDAYGQAVKDAGMDLVTLANNHLFDVGVEAGMRTLDQLDKIGLDYVGAYRNKTEYNTPKIVNVEGKRIGVLAYTYGQNYFQESFFFDERTKYFERPIVSIESKFFNENVESVKKDFAKIKSENLDLIIVLPHMGEQFRDEPDKTQLAWCDIFVECGADIILSDHPHHVQPIEWRMNSAGKNVLIVHCPGNFINSYVDYDGDASMIVNCYVDKETMQPVAASVIPIYAYCQQRGSWIGLPTSKVFEESIYSNLSRADFRRISEVHKIVTGVALKAPLTIDFRQDEYFTFPTTGFVRSRIPRSVLEDSISKYNNSPFLQKIHKANSICFVGDSVTEGTKNGGVGWYEPLRSHFLDKSIYSFAKGSQTSLWLLNNKEQIAAIHADLYVIAIGCNDIRYRNPEICAITSENYISNLRLLIDCIKQSNCNADFVFIAPWRSLSFDAYFNIKSQVDRMAIYKDYISSLQEMCKEDGWIFINPNPQIFEDMTLPTIRTKEENILLDWIHPTAFEGVAFYCKAVIRSSYETATNENAFRAPFKT